MKLSGSYQINLSKEKVWEALNNPEILKKAIPGCEEFTKNSDTEFTAKATNKIGPFNASFTGDVELKDLNPPNSYKITGSGNSPVGFASGEAFVKLEDNEQGTKLIYEQRDHGGCSGRRAADHRRKRQRHVWFLSLRRPRSQFRGSQGNGFRAFRQTAPRHAPAGRLLGTQCLRSRVHVSCP